MIELTAGRIEPVPVVEAAGAGCDIAVVVHVGVWLRVLSPGSQRACL